MNQATYQSYLTPQFQFHLPKDRSEAADAMTNAYHLSNIGQTTTPFAAPLLNANKGLLKTFIQLSLDINFYGGQVQSTLSQIIQTIRGAIELAQQGARDAVRIAEKEVGIIVDGLVSKLPAPLSFIGGIIKGLISGIFRDLLETVGNIVKEVYKCLKKLQGLIDLLDVSKIAYTVMSAGYCLYWLTAKMSPVPPMPPCIAPTTGTIILIPGLPVPLNSDLANTFRGGNTVVQAIGKLYNSLTIHQLSIIGLYIGLVPSPIGPVGPIPIPWFSMLNIPFPNIGKPGILGGIDSKGAEKEKEKQKEIEANPGEATLKAGQKLKKATDGMKKQSEDNKPC